ncbi:C2 domain [Phytophthora infestans]|uniref:C2 domain n=1 Tax=Phytophthora infestans TaxID=4787 RepID=A0A833SVA0_PHYIN|nr:C2 domain [Phytophthora infestans]
MAPAAEEKAQRYKLVVRVHSAEELQHSSSQGAYCKLYVGATAMTEGSHKALSKKDSNDSSTSNEDVDEAWHLEVRRTRTQHQQPNALAPSETIWDEAFEVPIRPGVDLATQILSIRVKSHHLFFCPVVGACAVSLANLLPGERLEQWFPLQKGKKPAGRIRVMLLIVPEDKAVISLVPRRKQPNQDIMAARAANHEADEAIKRLVDKQLRQEAERRQRRLERTSSGPPVEVKRPVDREASHLIGRKMDEVAMGDRHKRGGNSTWPPPPGVSSPKVLPPLGTPAAFRDNNKENELPSPPPTEQPVSPMSEYEQRLDKKLRQVRKETARLRKLKMQLKKYIPDLQMDSDSDDSLESDEEPEMWLSGSSSGSERHHHRVYSKETHLHNQNLSKVKSATPDGSKVNKVTRSDKHGTAVVF